MKTFASSVLYVSSIVVAIAIGMFQVGGTNNPVLPQGSGGPGCNYDGYTTPTRCAFPCLSGNYKIEKSSSTAGEGEFRDDGSTSAARGDCGGNARCTTPVSIGLASGPCAG